MPNSVTVKRACLPTEIWLYIFDIYYEVTIRQPGKKEVLGKLMLVCRHWHDMLQRLRYRSFTWNITFPKKAASFNLLLSQNPERFELVRNVVLRAYNRDTDQSEGIPDHVLEMVARFRNVRRLELRNTIFTDAVMATVHDLPLLEELHIQDVDLPERFSVAPSSHSNLRLTHISLHPLHYKAEEDLVAFLTMTRSPVLRVFEIFGSTEFCSAPITDAMSNLLSQTVERLTIYATRVEDAMFMRLLESCKRLQHLDLSFDIANLNLSASALPLLSSYHGRLENVKTIVAGRPVTDVVLQRETVGDNQEEIRRVLRELTLSSLPLQRLTIHPSELTMELLNEIAVLFPLLQRLTIRAMEPISKIILQELADTKLLTLRSCTTLDVQSFKKLSSTSQYDDHFPAEMLWQWERVIEWETACHTLRNIRIEGITWVRVAAGEWKGYYAWDTVDVASIVDAERTRRKKESE